MTWLSDTLTWIAANQAILIPVAVLLLASLKNGLTKHPYEQNVVQWVIDRLSFVTHSNSPGSLKLPGMASKAPEPCEPEKDFTPVPTAKTRGAVSGAGLGFLLVGCVLAALALSAFSCANLAPAPQQILDCGITDLGPTLLQTVEIDLMKGNWDGTTALDNLLAASGPTVVCAVEAIIGDLTSSHATNTAMQENELVVAQTWLASNGHAKLVKGSPKLGAHAGRRHL